VKGTQTTNMPELQTHRAVATKSTTKGQIVRTWIASLAAALPLAILSVFVFVLSASAQVSNYVSLDTVVSSSASSFATNLPAYILAGLGIFVALVLFRFGVRLLRRWVH
jgi:hypothetical protein